MHLFFTSIKMRNPMKEIWVAITNEDCIDRPSFPLTVAFTALSFLSFPSILSSSPCPLPHHHWSLYLSTYCYIVSIMLSLTSTLSLIPSCLEIPQHRWQHIWIVPVTIQVSFKGHCIGFGRCTHSIPSHANYLWFPFFYYGGMAECDTILDGILWTLGGL